MIGCLWTRVRKQSIIALYFEFETVLKFYNLGARFFNLLSWINGGNRMARSDHSLIECGLIWFTMFAYDCPSE